MLGAPFLALIATLTLLLAGGLEMARPWRPAPSAAGRRWFVNLSLYAISFGFAYVMAPIVAALVATIGVGLDLVERFPEPVRLALAILVLDLADYLLHRASHRVALLWRLHQPHHSDLELDVTTALRHHPLEAAVTTLVIGGGGALIGFTPGEIAAYGATALSIQLVAHANVALPGAVARCIGLILVTPDFHRIHHSRRRTETDANYSQVFSVWDSLFRTRQHCAVDGIEFGLDECRTAETQTLPRLLAQPLLPVERPAS